jgi:hypothetical protein
MVVPASGPLRTTTIEPVVADARSEVTAAASAAGRSPRVSTTQSMRLPLFAGLAESTAAATRVI